MTTLPATRSGATRSMRLLTTTLAFATFLFPLAHADGATLAKSAKTVSEVTGVPASVFAKVGTSSPSTSISPPLTVSGQKELTIDAKPEVLYIGAEYCPFCAAERWPLIVALSRFGTFAGLKLTESASSPEVYPNTPTFSFNGSTYASKYLSFTGVETETRTHQPLMNMTNAQSALVKKYDNATYISGLPYPDSIPFLDMANRYLQVGASFTPTILSGSTQAGIAAHLSTPTNSVTEAIVASANQIVADLCKLTKGQPANVCH